MKKFLSWRLRNTRPSYSRPSKGFSVVIGSPPFKSSMMDLAARPQYRMRAAVEYNRQMVGLFLQGLAISFQRNNIDESARASLAGFNPSLSNKTRNAALA